MASNLQIPQSRALLFTDPNLLMEIQIQTAIIKVSFIIRKFQNINHSIFFSFFRFRWFYFLHNVRGSLA